MVAPDRSGAEGPLPPAAARRAVILLALVAGSGRGRLGLGLGCFDWLDSLVALAGTRPAATLAGGLGLVRGRRLGGRRFDRSVPGVRPGSLVDGRRLALAAFLIPAATAPATAAAAALAPAFVTLASFAALRALLAVASAAATAPAAGLAGGFLGFFFLF